jgi:hypothetical protein
MKSSINRIVVRVQITLIAIFKTKKMQEMTIIQRIQSPTPKFFRILRNIGLGLVAAGGVLVAAPVSIPAGLIALGGYLIVAGSVATAVAQTAVEEKE